METPVECTWPLDPDRDIFQARGLWFIQLPDDIHPEVRTLPEDGRFIHRTPFIKLEDAERWVRDINEWKRRRGGRKKEPSKPDPKDYLNHDNEV